MVVVQHSKQGIIFSVLLRVNADSGLEESKVFQSNTHQHQPFDSP